LQALETTECSVVTQQAKKINATYTTIVDGDNELPEKATHFLFQRPTPVALAERGKRKFPAWTYTGYGWL
jgi:hypothetical protein